MTETLAFADATQEAAEFTKKPHVLLRNGFSIVCRPAWFKYDALLNEATFDKSEQADEQRFPSEMTESHVSQLDPIRPRQGSRKSAEKDGGVRIPLTNPGLVRDLNPRPLG